MTNSLSHLLIHCLSFETNSYVIFLYTYVCTYRCIILKNAHIRIKCCELNFHFLDNVQTNAWFVMECYFVAIIHSMSFMPENQARSLFFPVFFFN